MPNLILLRGKNSFPLSVLVDNPRASVEFSNLSSVMKHFCVFLGFLLSAVESSTLFYPFNKNNLGKSCITSGERGTYTVEGDCLQTKLLTRVGRMEEITYAGVELDLDTFVVCCVQRIVRVPAIIDEIGSRTRFISAAEQACNFHCKKVEDFVMKYHVIDGEAAEEGEFKHMAAIGYFNDNTKSIDFKCGGALVSDKFVLTAAHCTKKINDTPYMVRLGRVSRRF